MNKGGNGKRYRLFGGISITTAIAVIGLWFMLADRAATKIDEAVVAGEEKATHEGELRSVEKRVTNLEGESKKVNRVIYGEGLNDGMIQAIVELSGKVDAVDTQIGDVKEQNNLILEELRKIK